MHLKNHGFTLIEVLLSVTIAAVLMTGILVFVSSSLGSQHTTEQILQSHNTNNAFEQALGHILGNTTTIYTSGNTFGGLYLTGIIVGTTSSEAPVAYIGLVTATGYCDDYSGSASETGTVQKLVIRKITVPSVQNTGSYTVSLTGSCIYSGDTCIIGTSYPGDTLGNTGTGTELHSPSAVTASGIYLYVADTMNDRILAYNTIDKTIVKLL